MHVFGLSPDTQMDYANHCPPTQLLEGSKLLDCPELRGDIQRCQTLGIKVQLGLGGAAGSYGFNNDEQAVAFANQLWDTMFSGPGKVRPFGDVVLDGINLDIEGGNPHNYAAFVDRFRTLHREASRNASTRSKATDVVSATHQVRPIIVTAAPQCPYPDAYMHDVLTKSEIDAVYVQFYNNYCGAQAFGTSNFNFDVWDEWSRKVAKVNGAKIYLGVPASPTAANIGYVAPDKLKEMVLSIQSKYPSFGGVMMWDTSQAFANQDGGHSYAYSAVKALNNACGRSTPVEALLRVNTPSLATTPAVTTVVETKENPASSTVLPAVAPQPTAAIAATTTTITEPLIIPSEHDHSPRTEVSSPSSSLPVSPPSETQVKGHETSDTTTCPVVNGACRDSTFDCNGNQFAQCVFGRWVMRTCMAGTVCHRTADLNSVFCDFPTDTAMVAAASSCSHPITPAQKLAIASEQHSRLQMLRQQTSESPLHDQQIRMVYLRANQTHMVALASASANGQSFGRNWEIELAVPRGTRVVQAVRTQALHNEKDGQTLEVIDPKLEADLDDTGATRALYVIRGKPENEPESSMRVDVLVTLEAITNPLGTTITNATDINTTSNDNDAGGNGPVIAASRKGAAWTEVVLNSELKRVIE
ncbi:glycoside hydrolase superfamily [Syncephalis plumigaleata]|nr:glycoside hydrolase superfamily [Syncephalis plumigaleata]